MKRPPLVVLDTNVLEAAMRSRRGASSALLAEVGTGLFELLVSVPLVLEYEDVLMRQVKAAGRSTAAVRNLLDYLCATARHQEIFFLWRPVLEDPGDDMILEVAVAAQCDVIVTHNVRDFGPVSQFGLRVLKPGDFLMQIKGVL